MINIHVRAIYQRLVQCMPGVKLWFMIQLIVSVGYGTEDVCLYNLRSTVGWDEDFDVCLRLYIT